MVCVVHPGGARCLVAAAFGHSQKSRPRWKRRCTDCAKAKLLLPIEAPAGWEAVVDAAMAAFDEATTTRAAVADDGGGAGHAEEAALPARREATTVGVPQHPNTPTPQREGEGGEAGVDEAAAAVVVEQQQEEEVVAPLPVREEEAV